MPVLTAVTKAEAYAEAKGHFPKAKAHAQVLRNNLATVNYSSHRLIVGDLKQIRLLINRWAVLLAVPGLQAYAADQHEEQPGYNIVAELTAARNALIVVRDRIMNDTPKALTPAGVAGNIAIYSFTPDGDVIAMMFTPAQTVALRADLDAFIATVG